MTRSEDEDKELDELSDIYDTLRSDVKDIVHDLKGGVKMWSEAAGANLTAAGFILLHALASYRLLSNPALASEGGLIIVA
jgi:hypothetical protein